MKSPSSWNRRGSAVTTNGYFTVLRSTGWFPTFRRPNEFRYLSGQAAAHPADLAGKQTAANPPPTQSLLALRQIDTGQVSLRTVSRIVALALAALAITFIALWWIMHP